MLRLRRALVALGLSSGSAVAALGAGDAAAALALDGCGPAACGSQLLQTRAARRDGAEATEAAAQTLLAERLAVPTGYNYTGGPSAGAEEVCKALAKIPWSWTGAFVGMLAGTAAVAALVWTLSAPRPGDAADAAAAASTASSASAEPQAAEKPARRPQVLVLDGLRTVFIIYIVFFHVHLMIPMGNFYNHGHALMQFFFSTSGFVAVYGGADLSMQRPGGASAFIARRLARLCPTYYLMLWFNFLAMYVYGFNYGHALIEWPLASIFAQTLLPLRWCLQREAWPSLPMPTGWFVSVLVIVTLLVPALCRVLSKKGVGPNLMLLAAIVLMRSLPHMLFPSQIAWMYQFWHFYYFPLMRILELAAGMVTGFLFRSLTAEQVAWRGWGWVFDGVLVATIAFILAVGLDTEDADTGTTGPFCLMYLAAACSASTGEGGHPSAGVFGRVLAMRPLTTLAEYCYGAYLAQELMLHTMPPYLMKHPVSPLGRGFLISIFCFAASAVLLPTERFFGELVQRRLQPAKLEKI